LASSSPRHQPRPPFPLLLPSPPFGAPPHTLSRFVLQWYHEADVLLKRLHLQPPSRASPGSNWGSRPSTRARLVALHLVVPLPSPRSHRSSPEIHHLHVLTGDCSLET
jgi:hypothetical protein